MDDLMNKLQSVLNDEESMNQIKELANMLAGEAAENEQQAAEPAPQTSGPIQSGSGQAGGFDFSQLLQGLSGNSAPAQNPQSTNSNGFDISKIMQLQGVMQAANKPDKNVALLLALKPLLKEENQGKIDRVIKIFKLFAIYPVLKESGLLGGDLFGLL